MSEQVQKQPAKQSESEEFEVVPQEMGTDSDVDDLLDEIDDVLEENSQEFVTAFVQQGGELKPQARLAQWK